MLQSLREKFMGWPGVIIFGALGLLMAIGFGVGSYSISNRDTWVAKVGKHKISQEAFRTQMNNVRRQMSQAQGDKLDASQFQKPEFKKRVLDGMVDRYLLHNSSDSLGLVVTTSAIRQQIAAIPSFQVNGKFNPDSYRAVLASNHLTPMGFQAEVRANLQTKLLPAAIAASNTINAADVAAYLKLQLQTRDLHYVVLPRPALQNTKVSDAAIAKYYKAHQSEFMTPERVAVKYIELDAAKMKSKAKVDDAALKARYAAEQNKFVEPEQRLVSHILIKVPANATPAEQKKALAKAKKVDALAQAKDADFAALAKKYSDDAGSSFDGGNLGWLQKGVTNKVFQDALFALKKGQISAPVLSPDGYEIISLRNIRAGKAKPFSEVRDQLATEIKQEDRKKAFSKVAGKLTDLVYENPASLAPAADKLGLTIEQTGLFSRDGGKSGLTANPDVLKAAFSANVLKDGNTSDPINLGPNHVVVIHVVEHKKTAPKPLASVSDTIRKDILDQRVEQNGKKHAKALFAKLQKGKDLSKLAAADNVTVRNLKQARRHQQGVSPVLLDKAFTLPQPTDKTPSFGMVSLGNGSYALLALNAVHAGDLSKIPSLQRKMLLAQMRQAYATSATNEWLKMLKSKADIKISTERM